MSEDTEPIVHNHGFTKVRGTRYESVSGERIRIDRQKRMHTFRNGYEDRGPAIDLFSGTEKEARYVYEILKEMFDDRE